MSSALNGWQAFEEVSAPDVQSTSGKFVQLVTDIGLADLAEAFPQAEKSFASIFARLQDKQAAVDKRADAIEGMFDSTGTKVAFDHEVVSEKFGDKLGQALEKLRKFLDDRSSVEDAGNQPDLEPQFAGTSEGGEASGTPVGFNQDMVDFIDSGIFWYESSGQVASTITFGFTTSNSFAAGFGEQSGWKSFDEVGGDKEVVRDIIELWDDLIAPSIVEETSTPNAADIKLSYTTSNIGYAHAYFPGKVDAESYQFQKIQGSVWLKPTYNSGQNNLVTPQSGVYGHMAIAHEVGHALGLDHAGNYNGGSPQYGNPNSGWLYTEDTRQYTIMSYFSQGITGASWNGKYAQTPMVYDILSIQQMYGADYTTRATDTTYGFNSTAGNWIYDYTQNATPVMTIWDGDGNDTIDLSGWSTSSTLSLAAGSYSSVNNMTYNLAIAYDVDIENAIGGSGDDTLDGNDLDNVITGNAGDDTINGHFGNDTLYGGDDDDELFGGEGNDTLEGGAGADVLNGGAGYDRASYSGASAGVTVDLSNTSNNTGDAAGDTFIDIEEIQGSDFNDTIIGDAQGNRLYGNGGNDTLRGGASNDLLTGNAGADVLDGGAGWDSAAYASSSTGVTVDMSDSANSTGDAAGDVFIDIEVIQGSLFDDTIIGDENTNYLYGFAGNDTLRGGGGNDLLIGDGGADTLDGGEGFDSAGYATAQTGVTVDFSNPTNNTGDAIGDVFIDIEIIQASYYNDVIVGDAQDNVFYGLDGNDTLYGGQGNDFLSGDNGDDILHGGSGADTFFFSLSGTGTDYISDFENDIDLLDLRYLNFSTEEDVLTSAVATGSDVSIDFGNGSSVILQDFALQDFDSDDFLV